MNIQKEKEIKDLKGRLETLQKHLKINKKDYSCKVAVSKCVGKIRGLNRYLSKNKK